MSVNVRWNGRGWPGKVPRSPVVPPEGRRDRQKKKELEKGKTADRKGTVKTVWQKTGMAFKKKKKKLIGS
jgi:hypothetical protein